MNNLNNEQLKKLHEIFGMVMVECRSVCCDGDAERGADLMGVFHNTPIQLSRGELDLKWMQKRVTIYEAKYRTGKLGDWRSYLPMIEEIVNLAN